MTGSCDLHAHSAVSDGTLSPTALARAAAAAGLRACALTDHDTVAGAEEFLFACEKYGVEGVAGVELSVKYASEMHILGLFVNYRSHDFLERLSFLTNARALRNERMIALCRENGMNISKEELLSLKGADTLNGVGRPHFARIMLKKGYASSIAEAFDKYIGRGRPCYSERELYSPRDAVRLIKDAGGIAVLAHPIYITRERDALFAILSELKEYGLDGAECIYSGYDEEYSKACFEVCRSLGLLPSGGSDFHGENKPDVRLGFGQNGARIPYEFITEMKNRRNEL